MIVAALVAVGVLLFGIFEASLPQFASAQAFTNHITFFLLINLNILLLLVFVFLVGRNVAKLLLERRRGLLGSHLRARLVVAFVALSLIPAGVLFIAATNITDNSIERWFDEHVERSLEDARGVVADFYQKSASTTQTQARAVATAIGARGLMDPDRRRELQAFVDSHQRAYGISSLAVFAPTRELLVISFDPEMPSRVTAAPGDDLLDTLWTGRIASTVEDLDAGELIRGAAPVLDGRRLIAAVVVDDFIPREIADRSDAILVAYEQFEELEILKQPIKNTYVLSLSLITLVVGFAAIWYGLSMAKGITGPIEQLAEGTMAFAQGDWDVRIEASGDDELATLVRAFNQMTGDVKAVHSELEERRQHMETVLGNIEAGVVSVSPRGNVSTLNAAAGRLLGIDPRSARGRSVAEVFDRDELAPVRDLVHEVVTTGSVTAERQIDVAHEGGNFTLLVAAAPLREARLEEPAIGAVLFFEDVTEILKVQRMEAWREVAQRIAHEIKNPLTPIQLSAQRLQKRYSKVIGEEVFDECTGSIVKQVEALKSLVNEFSNFARLPTGVPEPCDLNEIVDEAVVLFREAHRGIAFDVDCDAPLPPLQLDREGVRRAIVNILDNAVAACAGRGRVEVKTQWLPKVGLVRLEIADDGPGMSPEVKARVFEPYFSTKREGTGLGLAIVQAICSDHRAFIRVRDNDPKGSRFVVEFPAGAGAKVEAS